jgi:hypothetical protein
MTRTKLGLLGLCAVVFGLMAFNATGAQAEGVWLILDPITHQVLTKLPAIVQLSKDKSLEGIEHYVLHSEILKIKTLFLCTEVKAVNAMIFGAGAIGEKEGVEKNSKVLFSGCTTELNGKAAPECTPTDPVDGKGFIVTKPGHALAALHNGTDIIIVLPDEGETFATIVLPKECPIGTSVPVIGKLALQDCENMALTHLVKHLVEMFPALTELFTISKTAEHAATLLGSAWALLVGEHKDFEWSLSGV